MKDFIYPTVIFIVFLYVLAFMLIYTYKTAPTPPTFTNNSTGTVNVKDLQNELTKQLKLN
ncbi:hypothetical protein [Helicobacter sp. 11S02629-2]|uniref:hypothetical protein n=1 Tax=Helicobacter sp. 11S02629-2 TaxID=1476195 RepID=UPI000BA64517|nr:hypothetical protein [Helicobacter sp. 11S02629-2]PAF44134.1 hypothetical protein BKH40_05920 [Helicobacter sp. 11S02629-2]